MSLNQNKKNRFGWLDSYRGFAVVNMIVFHFCFALSDLHFTRSDFYHDPFWLNWRLFIAGSFVLTMGMSSYLSLEKGVTKHYLIRIIKLLACSILISVFTFFTVGDRWVYFGILHFMTLAGFLILLFRNKPWFSGLVGALILFLTPFIKNEFFHPFKFLYFLGLTLFKPLTNDFAPLFPWFGVSLIGYFLMFLIKNYKINKSLFVDLKIFNWIGQKSLVIYMIHVPIIYILLEAYLKIV